MITVTLPWPSRDLSPNGRPGMWAHIKAKKTAKNYAWGMTKSIIGPLAVNPRSWVGSIAVHIDFIPHVDRDRDEDNFVASMKSYLDGIASALGVDDSRFRITYAFQPKQAEAKVLVTLMPSLVGVEVRGHIT